MAISDQTNVLVVEDDLAIADMLVELIREAASKQCLQAAARTWTSFCFTILSTLSCLTQCFPVRTGLAFADGSVRQVLCQY